jgi:hypothetical protein
MKLAAKLMGQLVTVRVSQTDGGGSGGAPRERRSSLRTGHRMYVPLIRSVPIASHVIAWRG